MDNIVNLEEVKFGEGITDEDLAVQAERWIKESRTYHDYLLHRQKKCEQYYLGNQTDRDLIPSYLTNTVENKIFEAVETVVPIITSSAHEFVVMPGGEGEPSVSKAEKLQKVLSKKYQSLEIQRKLEEALRHFLVLIVGVTKWEWDEAKDDIGVRVIDPRLMLVPKLRCDPHDLPYKIEIQEYTPEEIKNYFPDALVEELETSKRIDKGETSKVESKKTFTIYEIWTKEFLCWYSNNKILKKQKNPYYDFEGTSSPMGLRFSNFLDEPRDPDVFFTTYNIGDEPFGAISLVEAVIPVQDAINVQKRQIIDNLRRMGNGQVYIDADAMSREEAENITNEVGGLIIGEGVASQNKVRRESGLPLPNAHFSNLADSKVSFDNLFGTHSSTRGIAGAKTLGQDILSKQQDLTRIDLITRVTNRGIQRLAEGLVQLMKMFYTENHLFKILGEQGAVEFIRLSSEDIEDFIEVEVKTGRTPDLDRLQMSNQAIQLWQLQAIDPVTLFERLGFPNPEKAAQKLLEFQTGQLLQKLQMNVAEGTAIAGAKAPAAEEGAGRGVETPQNVISRARQQLGGAAPIQGVMPQV